MIILLFVIFMTHGLAGDRSSIRGMGMARTLNASARGLDALGINPANLALPGRGFMSLNVLSFGTDVSTELFSYDAYQDFFTGDPSDRSKPRFLTDDDKNRLLSLLPDGFGTTRTDLELFSLGFSVRLQNFGGLALGITDRMGMSIDLPKEYLRMFLFGFDSTGSTYDFAGTAISAWWWREYNISYGIELRLRHPPVRSIALGVGVKLIRGYAAVQTDHYNGIVGVERTGLAEYRGIADFSFLSRRSAIDQLDPDRGATFDLFPEPAGTGFGVDLGLSLELGLGVRIAASVTDIGGIDWEKNIVETSADYAFSFTDPFSSATQDSLENAFKGKNSPGSGFSTNLPTAIRLGVMAEVQRIPGFSGVPGSMLLALDINQGLFSSMGGIVEPRLSLGLEYRIIPLLPLRTGISFLRGDVARWSAGFGLDFYAVTLDVATENLSMVFSPSSFSMFSFSLGLRIRS
ncbi:MAG: hypothetical protein HY562_03930 [Ignavibacteriales bacterium]|nr:hypothetical protein [Ignavibacteriales bacterium]